MGDLKDDSLPYISYLNAGIKESWHDLAYVRRTYVRLSLAGGLIFKPDLRFLLVLKCFPLMVHWYVMPSWAVL